MRALGAGIYPRLDKLTQPLLRSRSGIAPKSWIPSPGDEVIRREVLMEQRQVASAIAAGILELCSDFTHRLSLPCHFDGSEAPAGMTRNALIAGFLHKREVALHVTGAASIPGYAAAVISAGDRRRVDMLIVALERTVGCRMTTHTARIHNHLRGFGEKRARTRLGILDARELGRRTQLAGILRRCLVTPEGQQ